MTGIANPAIRSGAQNQQAAAMQNALTLAHAATGAAGMITDPLGQNVIIAAQTDDGTYTWQQQTVKSDGTIADFTGGLVVTDDSDPAAYIKLASNQFMLVQVRGLDSSGNPCRRFVQISGGTSVVPCQITGAIATAAGMYHAYTYSGTPTLNTSDDLDLPDGMSAGLTTIVAINPLESSEGEDLDGSPIHSLTIDSWAAVLLLGVYQNADDDDDPDNGKQIGYLLGGGGMPAGGIKNDVITKFSDNGPAVWAAARWQ